MSSPNLSTNPIACLDRASKSFAGRPALRDVDLELAAGEILALLGPNGAGKTTTIGLFTGLLPADSGSASVFGLDPRARAARQRIGVMLQDTELPDSLRVSELVRQFSAYYPAPRPLFETLALAGVEDIADRRYGVLSGGQKRRVQFALAICGRPALLFVDEPTVGLDVEARRGFFARLAEMRDAGTAIVLTTHYLEEADALADRIVMLAEGQVIARGTPSQIKAHAAGKRVRFRSELSAETLVTWPEVEALDYERGRYQCRTRSAERLLRRLLNADASISELEVLSLSLEDAVLALAPSAQPETVQ